MNARFAARMVLLGALVVFLGLPNSASAQATDSDTAEESALSEELAEERDDARALFQAGRIAYDDARFDEALRIFQHAFDLSQRPALLFNIGLAHERLGDDERALDAFKRYLESSGDGASRAQAERRIAVLRQRLDARASTEASATAVAPPASEGSPAAWIVLGTGGALVVGGAVALLFGLVDRGAVEGSANGELEWADAESRLAIDDGLAVGGAIGLGVGAALALTSILLFESDSGGVTVSARGTTLVVGGRL